MARKATGSKEWRVRLQTWVGRVRGPDGKRTPWRDLGTADPALAQERLDRWIATGEPPSLASKELFSSAAERVVAKLEARGEKGMQNRRHRLRTFALPVIGHLEVETLEPHHIYSVLTRMGEQAGATRERYAADTVHHLRVDISRVLTELVREGVLKSNVARDVELPDDIEVDDRPRIVLTDDEVLRFRRRGFETELDMMALVARDLGGHRTSDLHAADYGDVDTVTWKTALVRRPKTDREGSRKGRRKGRRRATRGYERVRIAIPESVVGPLKAWWEKAGKPTTGPVFPLRRGPNAGQRKTGKGISYAQALRDALWEEGIVRPLPGFETAVGDERRKYCALQVDTDTTRAVDFHSFRRAFVTALARAGVNPQTSMGLSGHSDMTTHMGYYTPDVLVVPAAALPSASNAVAKSDTATGTAKARDSAMQTSNGAGGTDVSRPAPGKPSTMTPEPPAPADLRRELGQELTSAPAADLAGVRLTPIGTESTTAASMPQLTEVLENLLLVLRGGVASLPIDPQRGSNDANEDDVHGPNPKGFPRRARQDSNLGPTAPEAIWAVSRAQKLLEGDSSEPPLGTPCNGVLTQEAGQSGPDQTPLDLLRAAAHAALEASNWALLSALKPLIEAEQKQASALAPVSLEAVRAKRDGGK